MRASTKRSTCSSSVPGRRHDGCAGGRCGDLKTLVVEKSSHFGGSTALSGGGIWVPGAPSQRRAGYVPSPDGVFDYLKQITEGTVSDARLRKYVEAAPEMMDFLEHNSDWFEFVWKPGYADYRSCRVAPPGSTINVPEIDLRRLGEHEQELLAPLALAPRGIWFAPRIFGCSTRSGRTGAARQCC